MLAILGSAWRIFLFRLATWTTFNYAGSFQWYFLAKTALPPYAGYEAIWYQTEAFHWLVNICFFGNLDFMSSMLFSGMLLDTTLVFEFLALCITAPVYFWLREQSLDTAFWLALVGALVGPSAPMFAIDLGAWIYGVFGVFGSYFASKILNALREL